MCVARRFRAAGDDEGRGKKVVRVFANVFRVDDFVHAVGKRCQGVRVRAAV